MKGLQYLIYFLPMLAIWAWYASRRSHHEKLSAQAHEQAKASGLSEPATLHPIIDHAKCIGCGACVQACPEYPGHQILGLIRGKAHLVSPSECIGHGACFTACPADAITLVFGSEKRGVDIPLLSPTFETTVPGIYIAGELGGMGLIRNALTQGRQAMESIHRALKLRSTSQLDVVIIGAGPAGFAAALTAKSLKINYVVLEQESLGGAVFQYPRGKLVMTSPAEVPLVGKIKFSQTSKEELLSFWKQVEQKIGLNIRYRERVNTIQSNGKGGFVIKSMAGEYLTSHVLLAIGRRGTPRKLEVPGEDLPKVVYRLIDPEQYAGQQVLVVGGGDSALEAATSIADADGGQVTLSYRGDSFARAKPKNRERVEKARQSGRLNVILNSNVKNITHGAVELEVAGESLQIDNDAVIVSAGGVLPTDFLKSIGIEVTTKYGTA
jgi:thioredoxin reductase (NADPH)